MSRSALIDRGRELEALDEALVTAEAGEPQVVLVEGEAGVGKSSLLRAFRDAHPDVVTLAWAGDESESHLSFAMLDQLTDANRQWADPFTAGAALLGHLDELAAQGLVLLALDDVHLADPPSLVALNFAVRRLRRDSVVALFSARASHVKELPASILRLASASERRLVLSGLSMAGVQELAGAMGVGAISGRAAVRLHAVTLGKPLHLKALLSEVPTEDLERLDRPLPAPDSFAQLVLAGLASASPSASALAMAAAVLGDRCRLDLAAQVAGVDDEVALRAMDELDRLRLLRLAPGSSTAVFDHPLVRAAVYGDLGPAARAELHLAAAAVLDGWGRLQHRIAASHRPDPALAAELERWAEQERDCGDLAAAAEAILAAHRLTPGGPEADRRLLAAVALFALTGDAMSARAHAQDIAALPVSGLRLAVQARLAWLTGRPDDALTLSEQAWGRGDLDPPEQDLVAAMLATIAILRDQAGDAVAWATRALAEGRLSPAHASNTRAARALGLVTSDRCREALAGLADLPDDPNQVDIRGHAELRLRGHLRGWQGEHALAQRDLAVAAALTHGDMQPFRIEAAGGLAWSLFQTGQWDRSEATLAQALALAEDMEQTWMLGMLHAQSAAVPAARGDWATAEHHVAFALAHSQTSGELATAAYADDAAVLLATARGDPEAVVRAAERVRRAEGSPRRNLALFWWPAHLVSALVELRRLDEAEAELALLARHAGLGGQRTEAARLRVAGQLAAARHDPGAGECFAKALAVPEDRVDALERAMAMESYGRFLRRRGERRSAVDLLRQARGRYQSLGAVPFAGRCDSELAACGVHDPAVPTVADSLTPQERAVATLVCTGRTNREAAQELVLSAKTIGYHLGNVYAKLGVHSRAQLVAVLRDRGLASPAPNRSA